MRPGESGWHGMAPLSYGEGWVSRVCESSGFGPQTRSRAAFSGPFDVEAPVEYSITLLWPGPHNEGGNSSFLDTMPNPSWLLSFHRRSSVH